MHKLEFSDNFIVEDLGIIETTVYDIEVIDNHNFFANDICVHNSIYVNMSGIVDVLNVNGIQKIVDVLDEFCKTNVQKIINNSLDELGDWLNLHEQRLEMKREAIADSAIWTAKKRYILNLRDLEGVRFLEKPKLKMMGIETARSSTPAAIRGAMEKAIFIALNKTEADLHAFIKQFKDDFAKLKFDDVAFPRGINGLTKYRDGTGYKSGTPIQVRGALVYNQLLKNYDLTGRYEEIADGDKARFAYLKLPNPAKQNVIAAPDTLPKEFGLEKYIDYEQQFRVSFIEPLTKILDCVGWHHEQRNNLDDFFS